MKTEDDDATGLSALTGSISDGRAVDWEGVESGASDAAEQARIRALRDVARIADFSRGVQRASATDAAEAAPSRWGDLVLLEPVGAGTSGRVWRAWDARLQREVALKFLLPRETDGGAALAALLEEARVLARVHHPNVAAIYGQAEHDGRAGMWMEYVAGPTLAAEIERLGRLPGSQVARIGAGLARALAAVHAAGLVHRDVKPANIVLAADGRAVLTDFGLGLRPAFAGPELLRTTGTPMFMAPERLAGEPATARSDVYALGVALWWALAGHPPFAARTVSELEAEVARGDRRSLAAESSDAPPALAVAIERAMAPDPASRFASAEAMAVALEAAVAAPPRRRVSPYAILGAAAAVVLAILLVPRLANHRAAPSPTTATTPAAPPPPASAAPYTIEAAFVRRTNGAYRLLANGDRVAPGDRLSLQLRTSRPAWVYVLNKDERGETYLLFPQPLFDRANPIPPESLQVLPGPIGGRENAWTVTSRGGREHFLVIASPSPVAEIEAELARIPPARPGHPIEYAPVADATLDLLRGVGGVAPMPVTPAAQRSGAFERFESLAGRETQVHGLWARQVTLENPLR